MERGFKLPCGAISGRPSGADDSRVSQKELCSGQVCVSSELAGKLMVGSRRNFAFASEKICSLKVKPIDRSSQFADTPWTFH